jgi:hypothetical protein
METVCFHDSVSPSALVEPGYFVAITNSLVFDEEPTMDLVFINTS